MRTTFLPVIFFIAFAFTGTGELRGQAPTILEVRNTAWHDAGLSPGVRAIILGTGLRDAVVEVNGQAARIVLYFPAYDDWGGEELGVVFPLDLQTGPAEVVVRTAAGSSAPFRIVVNDTAPALFEGFRQSGRIVDCFTPGSLTVSASAPPGSIVTARGVGLGASTGGTDTRTVFTPVVRVGRKVAELVESVLSSDPGVFHVSFRVPPAEGYHAVSIAVGNRKSNQQLLPVGRALIHHSPVVPEGTLTAPDAVVTAVPCGGALATATASGDSREPPTSLSGTRVVVTDSAGVERHARLLYVSPRQVNYIMPSEAAHGNATVTITSADGMRSTTTLHIRNAAPHVYAVGPSPAAMVVRIREGVQTVENIFESTGVSVVPVPIDLGPESDRLILVAFGTGLRHASRVTATIGGIPGTVHYAGAQSEYPGLDQVNVELPRSLAGRRLVQLEVRADEQVASVAALTFK
jgi:uncharacterized protein (TIGR03437 family)